MKPFLFFLLTIYHGYSLLASPEALESAKYASAKKNYLTYCASCHGPEVSTFVDRKWLHGKDAKSLSKSIQTGWPDNGMPSFSETFSEEEVNELASYMLTALEIRESYDHPVIEKSNTTTLSFQEEGISLRAVPILTDLERPWGMEVTQDGTLFVTERKGTLTKRLPNGQIIPIKNVPSVRNKGQGGLLDVLLHPEFAENSILFLSLAAPGHENPEHGSTAVVRAKLVEDELREVQEIFRALPANNTGAHFGSRMVFDKEGHLFITVGDRGKRGAYPQDLSSGNGKVHRMYEDGSIPSDNPFVNQPNAVPSIYSYGHRNPQGLAIHPESGEIWEHEHGPRGGDEVNWIRPGLNYGWPVISYGINYNGTTFTNKTEQAGMEQPITYWTPSIAACGMDFIKGSIYGNWKNSLLSGSLRFDYVSRIELDGATVQKEEKILEGIGRVRSIEMGDDGYLYVGVESPGIVYRIEPEKR